jgi:hypothetical protein
MHRRFAVKRRHTMATPNPLTALKKLAAITPGVDEYSSTGSAKKETLHTSGRSFLRGLAKELGMADGSFDVRSNKAGIAVSGEVTLHSDQLYVQLSESCMGRGGISLLYRNCAGRRDCVGGMNNFIDAAQLQDGAYSGFVAKCKVLMETAPAPKLGARP